MTVPAQAALRRAVGAVMLTSVLLAACSGLEDEVSTTSAPESGAADAASVSVPAPKPLATTPIASVGAQPAELWSVVEVIDGDTIDVARDGEQHRVRIIGINAPETDECFYGEAALGLAALLPSGGVRLVADVSDTDQYGRLLRFVETADGQDLGGLLVMQGLARSQHFPPDTSRNVAYDELQAEALAQRTGQWAPEACGQSADGGGADAGDDQVLVELQYDAPGDDNNNLNEEWVRFTNQGTTTLDLSGWQVADESSSHRYAIADLRLDPGASFMLFTGCGSDTADERYWCNTNSAVWNNSGDTVFLKDGTGNLVTSYTYRGD